MSIRLRIKERWQSLRITWKFGLAFSLLLLMLLMQTTIATVALTIAWQSSSTIMESAMTQRLVTGISRNWEAVRRLEQSFFVRAATVGVDQAYQIYALPAGGKIAEVVRDAATLKSFGAGQGDDNSLQAIEPQIAVILSQVNQYATLFQEATSRELALTSSKSGLLGQLELASASLATLMQSTDPASDSAETYERMRVTEQDYLHTRQMRSLTATLESARALRQALAEYPAQSDAEGKVLAALDDYVGSLEAVLDIEEPLALDLERLDLLGQSIEPLLLDLMLATDMRSSQARQEIEQTRHSVRIMLILAMAAAVFLASFVGFILHHSVTKVIMSLTRTVNQFQQGQLEARSPIARGDELGQLASAFNNMTDVLAHRVTEIERLHDTSREQAMHDKLTGLYNRRYLDDILATELANRDNDAPPITLVMIDIDHFKVVNDRFGHAVGDQVLVDLAAILASQSRSGDVACRYGGEEFVVLMRGVTLAVGVRRADEWRQIFGQVSILNDNSHTPLSFSAGVVAWQAGESPTALLHRADMELYAAKNAGRNRISATGLGSQS